MRSVWCGCSSLLTPDSHHKEYFPFRDTRDGTEDFLETRSIWLVHRDRVLRFRACVRPGRCSACALPCHCHPSLRLKSRCDLDLVEVRENRGLRWPALEFESGKPGSCRYHSPQDLLISLILPVAGRSCWKSVIPAHFGSGIYTNRVARSLTGVVSPLLRIAASGRYPVSRSLSPFPLVLPVPSQRRSTAERRPAITRWDGTEVW